MEQEALLEVVTKSPEPSVYWVAVGELEKLSSYGFRVYCFLIIVTYISLSPLTVPQES